MNLQSFSLGDEEEEKQREEGEKENEMMSPVMFEKKREWKRNR